MPLFYFDVITPRERLADEDGIDLPSAEVAMLEASKGVVEISRDMILGRTSDIPIACRIEVLDDNRRLVFELPFAEVLSPPIRPPQPPRNEIFQSLHHNLSVTRRLREDIASGLAQAQQSIEGMRIKLAAGENADSGIERKQIR